MISRKKELGQFFTPDSVASALVKWAARKTQDLLLDPSCGDGQFLASHRRAVGIEIDPENAAVARQRAPEALIHLGDFFTWAERTTERFDAAAGNPPFIRYQRFSGETRERALEISARLGARFNGLSSSWAPFLVVTASLLKPGGRMAFVVPAEIGHATYATPLLKCLCEHFERLGVVALREKLFPAISEDAWLLYCDGFGGCTNEIEWSCYERFSARTLIAEPQRRITLSEWRDKDGRLRPFLLPSNLLATYQESVDQPAVRVFSDLAHAGIGYVTGANAFFHLRPSEARLWEIPNHLLRVSVRKAEQLPNDTVSPSVVERWLADDKSVLLLDLNSTRSLPEEVKRYLSTENGERARQTYKCQNREPWYAVPDVTIPDGFLAYMSGLSASLVANAAGCVCTNSLHAVQLKTKTSFPAMQRGWRHPVCRLSCELEGHPLGGGMLKLEPGEVARTRLPVRNLDLSQSQEEQIKEGISLMQRWRHYE